MNAYIVRSSHGAWPIGADSEPQARELAQRRLSERFPGEVVTINEVVEVYKAIPPIRGGPRPNSGRPSIKPGEETVTVSLRLTHAQRDKLAALGGAAWVRARIDKARTA